MRSDGEPFRHGIKARHRSPRLSALGKQRSRKPGCWGAASGQGTTALSCSKTQPSGRRETVGPVRSSRKVPRKPGSKRRPRPRPERMSRFYSILLRAAFPELQGPRLNDAALFVYGSGVRPGSGSPHNPRGKSRGSPGRERSLVRRAGQRGLAKRGHGGRFGARLSAGGRESGGLVYARR